MYKHLQRTNTITIITLQNVRYKRQTQLNFI